MSSIQELREYIYREVQREYHIQDAMWHVSNYLERHNIDIDANEMNFDFDYMAEMFEENHDCNVADNDQWDCIVREYIKTNYPDLT